MKFYKYILYLIVINLITSCTSTKIVDVKSPCVDGENGPCGPRKPVNTWLKEYNI